MNRPGTPLPVWLREQHREATRPLPVLTPPGALGPSRVHCYVAGPDDAPGWWPAVLVQWRRDGGGWVAQVAYVVDGAGSGGGGGAVLVVAWVGADQLRPA